MRTLHADLTTAQRAATRRPFVRLEFNSRDRQTTRIYSPLTLYESWSTGAQIGKTLSGAGWLSQGFTPSVTHSVTKIEIKGYRVGSPGTITASIRAVDGSGFPTGSDINGATGTINGSLLTTDTDGQKLEFLLSTIVKVESGTTYAIVIRATAGSGGNTFTWLGDNNAGYSGGRPGTSSNSGSSWVSAGSDDMWFWEYGML
ncbi:hypothetical protein LCGC14_1585820 [marine sediment metagenome]|uniref:Uncharacterized protein n=1 Tax=marine sediment metagenome TaxID=412755 RepID=A0A0F9KW32_9ZZZZ